jgi:hypothetical protein
MTDRYTKAVLTAIAAALLALVFQQAIPRVAAQISSCGSSSYNSCHITIDRGELSVYGR